LNLTDDQRATLERWVRAGTTPQRLGLPQSHRVAGGDGHAE